MFYTSMIKGQSIASAACMLTLLIASIGMAPLRAQNADPLLQLLEASTFFRDSIAPHPQTFELQAILHRYHPNGEADTYRFGLDTAQYFYPASTVKLPVLQLALEKLHTLHATSQHVLCLERTDGPECRKVQDDLLDILVLSDNEAFNRLFDWLGPVYIQQSLKARGIRARIRHRLGRPATSSESDDIALPGSYLLAADGKDTLWRQPARIEHLPNTFQWLQGQQKGQGFFDREGRLVEQAFDFSKRNYLDLEDMLLLTEDILRQPGDNDALFDLAPADRHVLWAGATHPPRLSPMPAHHSYEDGYVKFVYHGGSGMSQPGDPLITNKVGIAYGTITDAAILLHPAEENRPRVALAITLLVNRDGIFNDDLYEYESIGLPFLREIGRLLWDRYGQ